MQLIIDVRTREEFVKNHIIGALNIPFYDLQFHIDFLKDKNLILYCNTEIRSIIAKDKLASLGLESRSMPESEMVNYEWVENNIICAINRVQIAEGQIDSFMEKIQNLSRATESMEGFLGSKILKDNGISGNQDPLNKFILMTYWSSKEAHDNSHLLPEYRELFDIIPTIQDSCEEFYEILK